MTQLLTDEQKKYNRDKGSFKRRIQSMLNDGLIKSVEDILEIIQTTSTRLYKDIKREDAVRIIKDKIRLHIKVK